MTSFSFVFGVIPLVTATGAASEMRQALGTSVFFGMLGVTTFGLIFTPVFYVVIRGLVQAAQHGRPAYAGTARRARLSSRGRPPGSALPRGPRRGRCRSRGSATGAEAARHARSRFPRCPHKARRRPVRMRPSFCRTSSLVLLVEADQYIAAQDHIKPPAAGKSSSSRFQLRNDTMRLMSSLIRQASPSRT